MANEKIIAQDVFEQSIKDILTLLVNNTYNFTEYTDEEVGNLIDLDPTQIAELTAVISDSVVAKNKVFSSSHTTELIQKSVIESNEYADSLVANLSNIKLDIVDTLPDASTVNKSTIYILKDSTGGTNNTLNVWSDATSAFVEVGKLSVDFTNYYTKSEVDTELDKKANADEVLKPDAIVSDLSTTSGSTTLSTAGLQTELDKKANDDEVLKTTDISTTIDGTSTNDTVPTNKAVYDSLLNKVNNTIVLTTADEVNSFDRVYQSFIIEPSVAEAVGLPKAPDSTWFCINLSHFKGFKYPSQIAFEYAGIERIMYRTAHNGVWHKWKKLCVTSVKDVPLTTVPLDSSKFSNGHLQYEVKNGTCHVYINALNAKATFLGYDMSSTPMPKPSSGLVTAPIVSDSNGVNIGLFYVDASFNSTPRCHIFTTSLNGYVTFSYTVAES